MTPVEALKLALSKEDAIKAYQHLELENPALDF